MCLLNGDEEGNGVREEEGCGFSEGEIILGPRKPLGRTAEGEGGCWSGSSATALDVEGDEGPSCPLARIGLAALLVLVK